LRGVVGLVIPAALALTGCGAGDDPSAREERCGYDKKTLLPAMEAAVPEDFSFHVAMDLSGAGQELAIDATIARTSDGADAKLTYEGPDEEFALIVVDDRVFFSRSVSTPVYQELDASDPTAVEMRRQAESMDVTSEFAAWRAGLVDVKRRGDSDVDGQRTCRYSVAVDSAAAALGDGESPGPGLPDEVTYDVYLDDDDLMRRVVFELNGVEFEGDVTEWNQPVDIKAPSGDQLQD
jgi:hypothetical protein